MQKIDVCLNVLGKPWQTLVTLRTLIDYCGENIDKIFIIEERKQPKIYDFNIIKNNLNYESIVRYVPKYHLWVDKTNIEKVKEDEEYRLSLRYQYGIENTDKKYLLLIHNDILFMDNVVEQMLELIEGCFCVGKIGQCWNCPLYHEKLCSGELLESRIEKNDIKYEEIINYVHKYPDSRTALRGNEYISKTNPFPMPECRVNEWCALINVEIYKKETIPNGDVVPFGGYFGVDIGDIWFKQMIEKKYKFKNFEKDYVHVFFSEDYSGHSSMFSEDKYLREEEAAKNYFDRFLKNQKEQIVYL